MVVKLIKALTKEPMQNKETVTSIVGRSKTKAMLLIVCLFFVFDLFIFTSVYEIREILALFGSFSSVKSLPLDKVIVVSVSILFLISIIYLGLKVFSFFKKLFKVPFILKIENSNLYIDSLGEGNKIPLSLIENIILLGANRISSWKSGDWFGIPINFYVRGFTVLSISFRNGKTIGEICHNTIFPFGKDNQEAHIPLFCLSISVKELAEYLQKNINHENIHLEYIE